MKKIRPILYLLLIILLFMAVNKTMAQGASVKANDKIIFLNGDTREGKVTAFSNEKIRFIHCDETLDYEFNKKEIEKIEYGSGRIELITVKKTETTGNSLNTKNRVAVIPMQYIGDGNEERTIYMQAYLQEITISYLSKSATELNYLDVAEVNAILLKNEITDLNIKQYTPKELADLLQVEYIIMGTVLQDKGNIVTVVDNNSSRKQTIEQTAGQVKVSGKNNSHGSQVTRQDIETQVSLSIYSESGQKLYDNSRHSILSEADAYKNAMKYLLKRTPLYKK